MANRRMLSKSISTSKKMAHVSDGAAVLYLCTIPHCDDNGNMDADPLAVKGIVVPMRPVTVPEVEAQIQELTAVKLVVLYKGKGDETFLHIVNWEKFQTLRKDVIDVRYPDYIEPEKDAGLHDVDAPLPPRHPNLTKHNITEHNLTKHIDPLPPKRGKRKKKPKKQNTDVLTKEQQRALAFLQWWNQTFGNSYRNYDAISTNLDYWLKKYSAQEIALAAVNIKNDKYWKNIIDPMKFLRQGNPRGERVDRIGEFLNASPTKPPLDKMIWSK